MPDNQSDAVLGKASVHVNAAAKILQDAVDCFTSAEADLKRLSDFDENIPPEQEESILKVRLLVQEFAFEKKRLQGFLRDFTEVNKLFLSLEDR